MYEAVAVGERSTPSRLAATAADVGFDGVVLRNAHGGAPAVDPEAIREATGVDVAVGGEVAAAEPSSARGRVGSLRPEVECLFVRGGSPAMNRFAVETPAVDVLAGPMSDAGDLNHVMATAAAENDVHLEVDLGPVLRTTGGGRVRAIQGLLKLQELVADADAPYVVSAGAGDHLAVRSPRALCAVGDAIGLGERFVENGLAAWDGLLDRRRRQRDDRTIGPGVRLGNGDREPEERSP